MATRIHFASFFFRELVAESDVLDTVAHLLYFGDVKVLTTPQLHLLGEAREKLGWGPLLQLQQPPPRGGSTVGDNTPRRGTKNTKIASSATQHP